MDIELRMKPYPDPRPTRTPRPLALFWHACLICCCIGMTSTPLLAQQQPVRQQVNRVEFKTPTTPSLNALSQQQSQAVFSTPNTPTREQANEALDRTRSGVRHVSFESTAPGEVLKRGRELEKRGQWGEALSLYQQVLRDAPNRQDIQQRRAIARIHFDLERRYSDSSFLTTIRSTGATKALNVYAEVLLKIESYYVDQPNWNLINNFGLTSLEVALTNPEFIEKNLKGVSPSQIKSVAQQAFATLDQIPVNGRTDNYSVANQAAKIFENNLGLPAQATVYEFVCGTISALDAYSAFMSSNQYSETMSQIEGNFVGLGVELRTSENHLEIVSVIPGGSAGTHGIREGDKILAVDNQQVSQIGSERAADMLRGLEGSFVLISIDRGGVVQTARLERRRVDIPSVDQVSIVDRKTGIGYIRLTNFQKTTARDFDAALWKLHRDGMSSLIVDVRGNPGGLLSASVEVADRFVNNGIIVSTRGRNPLEDYTHRARSTGTWQVPLVVLMDENSASASEIFAAAIRDHRRGQIVGEKSYGKGSVQGIFPLNASGGGVRLTTAKFYSPSGRAISDIGVAADVQVRSLAKPSSGSGLPNEDQGLRVSINVAKNVMQQVRGQQRKSAQSGFGKPSIAGR